MEEVFLLRMSLEDVQAYLFSCPDTGCLNWHIFDYTRPVARAYWANGTSAMLNRVGAAVVQWDGAEFQPTLGGWDVPHSANTVSSGLGFSRLWSASTLSAFSQSRALWAQPTAVEMSLEFGGLGAWRSDMSPFADEGDIQGSFCGPGGDAWHGQMLLDMLRTGVVINAYNTDVGLFGDASGPSSTTTIVGNFQGPSQPRMRQSQSAC